MGLSSNKMRPTLGRQIREARRERRLTREMLAGTEFSTDYVDALERGAVCPSPKALELFAGRLGVPLLHFTPAGLAPEPGVELDMAALQEDLRYQFNYAKMMIRGNGAQGAFALINEIERGMLPFHDRLPASLLYLPPFLRARAYIELMRPELVQAELAQALDLAGTDAEAAARVHNLMGTTLHHQEQPQAALPHYLLCLRAIADGAIKDLNFRVSVYRNLANAYLAVGDPNRAISVYKETLGVLHDLDDQERRAAVFWGLAEAYKSVNDMPNARLYAARALHIYEAQNDKASAVTMNINLAELLLADGRHEEAQGMLARAELLLEGTTDDVLLGNLFYDYAELARCRGELEQASTHLARSLELLERVVQGMAAGAKGAASGAEVEEEGSAQGQAEAGAEPKVWSAGVRTYAEALRIGAMIEEDKGNRQAADALFQSALTWAERTGYRETVYAINFSYGVALRDRGDFKRAVEYLHVTARAPGHHRRRHRSKPRLAAAP